MMTKVSVTLRVTKDQVSFKKDRVRFSAVRVDPVSLQKISAIDFYNVNISDDKISLDPTIGQIWQLTGTSTTKETNSHCGRYNHRVHEINDVELLKFVPASTYESFFIFLRDDKQFVGIAEKVAKILWPIYGKKIFNIKENNADDLLKAGLTPLQCKNFLIGMRRYSNLKYAEYFTKKGIPLAVQKRIFKFNTVEGMHSLQTAKGTPYSVNVVEIIKNNPYLLMTFGLSFKKTDYIAQNHFDASIDDVKRLQAAIQCAIKKNERNGHTLTPKAKLRELLLSVSIFDGNEIIANKALLLSQNKEFFIYNKQHAFYQTRATYLMENVVAKRLIKLSNRAEVFNERETQATKKAFDALPFELLEAQTEAVIASVGANVSCITGGAGTGKTTILKTIVHAYKKMGFDIYAMALSGRAAMRMKESIELPTSTIAKFLKGEPLENSKDKAIVVIDESSMLDLITIYRIVTHINSNVRILFVGDRHQLPSIGAGNILTDIVKSKVIIVTELAVMKRSDASTGIPEYSNLVRDGIVPKELSTAGITFHDTAFENVAKLCTELHKFNRTNSKIVAPINQIVDDANKLCQDQINPDGDQLIYERKDGQWMFQRLHINDPILFTQNNYDKDVQNGTLGTLIDVTQTETQVGIVKVDGVEGDKALISLNETLLLNMKLGYAMTLHKAQGSQFPIAIVALSAKDNLDRAWLYTAITRAELEVHIVGPKSKLISAIKNISNTNRRQTYLAELLKADRVIDASYNIVTP